MHGPLPVNDVNWIPLPQIRLNNQPNNEKVSGVGCQQFRNWGFKSRERFASLFFASNLRPLA